MQNVLKTYTQLVGPLSGIADWLNMEGIPIVYYSHCSVACLGPMGTRCKISSQTLNDIAPLAPIDKGEESCLSTFRGESS